MRNAPDWPRLMRRATAAAYCDLSPAGFEREVAGGTLPLPVKLDGVDHWCRAALDGAVERLTGGGTTDWEREQPGLAA